MCFIQHVPLSSHLRRNMSTNKSKGKVHPTTGHECPEGEYGYSYTLSLTSALDESG
jgi:hypothetical protein